MDQLVTCCKLVYWCFLVRRNIDFVMVVAFTFPILFQMFRRPEEKLPRDNFGGMGTSLFVRN